MSRPRQPFRRVITFLEKLKTNLKKSQKPFEELHLLIYSETITGNRLHKAFM